MNKLEQKLRKKARFIRGKIQCTKGNFDKNLFSEYKGKKKIFYMLVPTHGNLGDQAIAYASIKFLKDKFKEYEIIEVNSEDTYLCTSPIKKSISKEDIIILHGGGNMGTHYITEEEKRRHIISTFQQNKIVSFTQTIYFEKNKEGELELEKSKKIYDRHYDLTILAREKKSYEKMRKEFKNINIVQCPDIVFYLNNKLKAKEAVRNKITTLLRKDKETYINFEEKELFLNNLNSTYNNIVTSDTLICENVSKDSRHDKLYDLWNQLYDSKVVITDRLHGMIFCAITKTPCIVTRSLDHKVVESYKWIQSLNYIRLVDTLDFNIIHPIIEELANLESIDEFDFDSMYFKNVVKIINI